MMDYDLIRLNYIGDVNTPFDKMLCDVIDKYRDGMYKYTTLYIWIESGDKLCLSIRLNHEHKSYEIGVASYQGVASGLNIHNVTHMVTSDDGIGFYYDTDLLAYSNGDLGLRADITMHYDKYTYRKLENEMGE